MIAPVQRHSRVGSEKNPHWTGVHGRDEHEVCRERKRHIAAGEGNGALLKWLTQHFEYIARELREFVQEQDAVMSQAHLARPGRAGTAANKACIRDGVVGGAEGPLREQARAPGQEAGDAVDLGGL